MEIEEFIAQIRNDPESKIKFVESFITDVIDQLDIIDPDEESDIIIDLIENFSNTTEGQQLLSLLLGVAELEEWIEELADF